MLFINYVIMLNIVIKQSHILEIFFISFISKSKQPVACPGFILAGAEQKY